MKIFYSKIARIKILSHKYFIISVLLLVIFSLIYAWGFRYNYSHSMPIGIYRISESFQLNHGDYVKYCLEDETFIKLAKEREYIQPGMCTNGLSPLLKTVYALAGDNIKIDMKGLKINDFLIPNSMHKNLDSQNRILPSTKLVSGKIPEGFALILANHEGSCDSRYFGLVEISKLQKAIPVFIWSKKNNAFKEN